MVDRDQSAALMVDQDQSAALMVDQDQPENSGSQEADNLSGMTSATPVRLSNITQPKHSFKECATIQVCFHSLILLSCSLAATNRNVNGGRTLQSCGEERLG